MGITCERCTRRCEGVAAECGADGVLCINCYLKLEPDHGGDEANQVQVHDGMPVGR